MIRNPLIAASFALAFMLTACAPPQESPQAEDEASAEETSATDTGAPAEETVAESEPEPPPPAPKPKPKPPAPAPVAAPEPPPVCNDCGTVASIEPVKEKGQGSGAGAVMGAIAGGVIGHQFGGGRGKDLATAAGAIAGGVAGHKAEEQIRATSYYRVGVRMENGGYQTVNIADPAGIAVGTPVRVIGGNLQLR